MKKSLSFILLLLECLVLTACGAKNGMGEKEICESIVLELDIFQKYEDLEILTFEIFDRRTDTEEKIDAMHFLLKAENEIFTYEVEGNIICHLYEQGWMLESMGISSEKSIPHKSDVTQENADMIVKELGYDETIADGRYTDLENGTDYFYYKAKKYPFPYWIEESYVSIKYVFDTENGWYYEENIIDTLAEYWNKEKLCGEWIREDHPQKSI